MNIYNSPKEGYKAEKMEQAFWESEDKLNIALNNSPFTIVVAHVDRDQKYTFINNPHPDFNPEDVLGKRDDEITKNEGTIRLRELKREVIETGVGRSDIIKFPVSNGSLIYKVSVEPLYDGSAHIIGATSVSIDITSIKQAEEELARLYSEVEQLSFQDDLTGIANRRMIDKTLDREWGRAQRVQTPLSLIILDVDFFKQFNDCYGHLQGDKCLKQVAKALSRVSKRTIDLIGRYGGEEFIILLPETNETQAIQLAEQCFEAVKQLNIPHKLSKVGDVITVSAGISTIIPSVENQPSTLIEAADKLLYQAKKNGRNRFEFQ